MKQAPPLCLLAAWAGAVQDCARGSCCWSGWPAFPAQSLSMLCTHPTCIGGELAAQHHRLGRELLPSVLKVAHGSVLLGGGGWLGGEEAAQGLGRGQEGDGAQPRAQGNQHPAR